MMLDVGAPVADFAGIGSASPEFVNAVEQLVQVHVWDVKQNALIMPMPAHLLQVPETPRSGMGASRTCSPRTPRSRLTSPRLPQAYCATPVRSPRAVACAEPWDLPTTQEKGNRISAFATRSSENENRISALETCSSLGSLPRVRSASAERLPFAVRNSLGSNPSPKTEDSTFSFGLEKQEGNTDSQMSGSKLSCNTLQGNGDHQVDASRRSTESSMVTVEGRRWYLPKELHVLKRLQTDLITDFPEHARSYETIFTTGNSLKNAVTSRLGKMVEHFGFESVFATLILMNTLIIALEAQYRGFQIGYELGYPLYTRPQEEVWPSAKDTFVAFDYVFGMAFTIEVLLKIIGMKYRFLKSAWNLMDATIVVCWIFQAVVSVSRSFSPLLFRLVRLARILRLVRLFKTLSAMDSLHVLIKSIKASLSALVWSSCVLAVMIASSALFVCGLTQWYLTDATKALADRREVFEYFGTFARSSLSMFEVTLGNFAPVMRVVTEHVDEQWGWFFIVYKCVGGFAVISVITGVFLQETFHVASSDDDLLVIQQRRQKVAHLKKMTRLFEAADRSGQGSLNYNDFKALVSDPFIKTWLAAYELDAADAKILFALLDDGDGKLNAEDLVNGVSRLKGFARSLDVHAVVHELTVIKEAFADIYELLILEPREERETGKIKSDSSPCGV